MYSKEGFAQSNLEQTQEKNKKRENKMQDNNIKITIEKKDYLILIRNKDIIRIS